VSHSETLASKGCFVVLENMLPWAQVWVCLLVVASAPPILAGTCGPPEWEFGYIQFTQTDSGHTVTYYIEISAAFTVLGGPVSETLKRYDPATQEYSVVSEGLASDLLYWVEKICTAAWVAQYPDIGLGAGVPVLTRPAVSAAASVTPTPSGQASQEIANGDLNGDGIPDVAFISGSGVTVQLIASDGSVLGTTQVTLGFVPSPENSQLILADFNGDGKLDLVVSNNDSNSGGPGAIYVLLGNGDGTFGAARSFAASGVIGAPQYNFVGGHPAGIAAADLNGDGQPDVVITGGSSDVSVMIAQSGTTFKAPLGYSLGPNASGPQAVALGDLNGDNKPDVIVANLGNNAGISTAPAGTVSVFLNNGDGTLKPPTTTTVNETAQSLALGDFNKDGMLDIAVAAYGDQFGGADQGGVTVLLGKGDGTFQPSPAILTVAGLHPVAVAQGDVNGDGKLDLAVLMAGTLAQPATLAVFLGQGNGTFAAARTFPLRALADIHGGVATGDVNGDGKPDIAVVTGYGGQAVDILLGDGAGGFAETTGAASANPGPRSVILTDLNGDGNLDLVLSDSSQDATFLLGNGDGTFQAEQHFISGAAPVAIATAKFAGSKGPDLVVANGGGTWLSLVNAFPNPAPPTPASAGPASGSNTTQTFTCTFTDAAGYQKLSVVDVLINNALDGRHACYIAFAPASGSLYLVGDAGDAGGPYSGMVLPGNGTVQNSRNCSQPYDCWFWRGRRLGAGRRRR